MVCVYSRHAWADQKHRSFYIIEGTYKCAASAIYVYQLPVKSLEDDINYCMPHPVFGTYVYHSALRRYTPSETHDLLQQHCMYLMDVTYITNTHIHVCTVSGCAGNGLPSWAPFMAIPFAVLATILLFMDQQITALIVNRKDHKLKVSRVCTYRE